MFALNPEEFSTWARVGGGGWGLAGSNSMWKEIQRLRDLEKICIFGKAKELSVAGTGGK